MTTLALRSLRHRPTAVVATFVAVVLGSALMASFATLVESATGAGGEDRELLITTGGIVGAWAALIVLFSVASTVGIVADQRTWEAALLRTIGATPRQARSLIVSESVVVTLVAAAAGAAIASMTGRALFDALQNNDLLTPAAAYAGGPASLSISAVLVVLVGTVAARIAARRRPAGRPRCPCAGPRNRCAACAGGGS